MLAIGTLCTYLYVSAICYMQVAYGRLVYSAKDCSLMNKLIAVPSAAAWSQSWTAGCRNQHRHSCTIQAPSVFWACQRSAALQQEYLESKVQRRERLHETAWLRSRKRRQTHQPHRHFPHYFPMQREVWQLPQRSAPLSVLWASQCSSAQQQEYL